MSNKVNIEISEDAAMVLRDIGKAFVDDDGKAPANDSDIVEALISMFAWFLEEEALSEEEWHVHDENCKH